MLRVLIVNNLYKPNIVGGAELSVEALAVGLRAEGHIVKVLSLGDELTTDNESYISFPMLNRVWPVKKSRRFLYRLIFQFVGDINRYHLIDKVKSIFLNFKPDVIHTNNLAGIGTHIWRLSKKHKIPVVHTLRDYYQLCAQQNMYKNNNNCIGQCVKCKFLTRVRKGNSKYVDFVVGNSKHTLDVHLLNNYFSNAQTSVISGGLKKDFIKKDFIKKEIGKIIKIGFLGQIIPSKGVEDIISLANNIDNISFYIAGTGNNAYIAQLKSQSYKNNVHWLGRVEPQAFLDTLSTLIVPSSWNEPLPRVIYEAYARGVTVIATDTGGNPEVIYPKHTNNLYKPGDVLQLLQIVKNLILEEPSVLQKYSENFITDRISSQYLDVYKEAIL